MNDGTLRIERLIARASALALALGLAARASAQAPDSAPELAAPGIVRTPQPFAAFDPYASKIIPRISGAPGTDAATRSPIPAGIRPVPQSIVQALQSRAHLPQGAPVPPTQEIEVLDPNVDPNGRPAVIPTIGPDGVARVDIPPSVLVHRYYYSGDRSFQAPLLPGGPTIIVINHPADGQRLYLQVQLPPGAPRVIYTRHSVEYNYGTQAVHIAFGAHCKAKITYRQGVSVSAQVMVASAHVAQTTARLVSRTGAPVAARAVLEGTANVAETAADRVHDVGMAVLTPVVKIVRALPGVNFLTSSTEERVTRERDSLLRRVEGPVDNVDTSIKTVR